MVKLKYKLEKFTVGMEIEIGVGKTTLPDALARKGWDVTGDGSISSSTSHAVEFRSGVYDNVWDLRKDLYLLKKHVKFLDANTSMGIHFHIKPVYPVDYSTLYSKDFVDRVIGRYKEVFKSDKKAQRRLLNHYCDSRYESDYFRKNRIGDSSRYKFVNIVGAISRHNTIEFRGFYSTKSVDKIFRFLNFCVDETERFIDENRNMKLEGVVYEEDDGNVEEITV